MTLLAICPVDAPASGPPPATCPVPLVLVAPQDTFSFADLGIDPQHIGEAFGWGFGAVIFCWALGIPIGAAITSIRKA